ncbi:ABC transporter permease [uncultured Microbacterium sp.]|uniref:ABC transporter permease n=1 Tax=uncultured Microbacterium sp. TaxID=191216 RepID=UPI0035CB40EB
MTASTSPDVVASSSATARQGLAVLRARHSRVPILIGRRLIQVPLVLLAVSILVFWLIEVVPGDPGRNALGQYATSEQVQAWNVSHGLTGSVFERYLSWLFGFITGDWGTSIIYGAPVRELILGRLGNSLLLGAVAFVILLPLAFTLGAVQARREGSRTDRTLTIGLMSLASVPEFVVGVFLLIVFSLSLRWFPIQSSIRLDGSPGEVLLALALPAITLALGYVSVLARMTRTGVLDTTRSQYYRTAVIKGLHGPQLAVGHVARNALIPTVSLLGIYLGSLLGGSAIVETLFGYPGLGALLVTATVKKDIFLLEAGVMVVGVIALLALLITDIAFVLIDPRVRLEEVD